MRIILYCVVACASIAQCNYVKPESRIAEVALVSSLAQDYCIGGSIRSDGVPYNGSFDAVFMFAGQSNMVGRANDSGSPEAIPGAYIWTGTRWEGYLSQTHIGQIGPDYSFIAQWAVNHPGQKVGIIKYACGGSSMAQWQPGKSFANNLYNNYIEAGSPNIDAVLWMQGEAESFNCGIANQYKERTQEFIAWQFAHFQSKTFVMGKTQKNGPCGSTVRDAQESLRDAVIVNIDDLPTESDGIHLNKDAQIEFGKRIYSAVGDL